MDSVNQRYFDKFEELEQTYDECSELLCAVEIMSDNKLYEHYRKQKGRLEEVVLKFKEYKRNIEELKFVEELFEVEQVETEKVALKQKVQELKIQGDGLFEDVKKIYFEQGSKEVQKAKIELSYKSGDKEFVFCLKQMFENFSAAQNFEYEEVSQNDNSIALFIKGENVYNILKCIAGVSKKIEKTVESSALVVVLLDEVCEIEIREEDIEIEISKSSGAGGQHINKTESAVKLIHLPTGVTAECQDERSQTKNKVKAMEALKQKIMQKSKEMQENSIKNQRKLLKNAIFSETPVLIFDFDRNKVTNNTTKKTYKIQEILQGNIKLIASDLSV